MTGRQLFVIIAALMLNGCFANSRSVYRLYHIDPSDPTKTTVIDAKQRAIISVSAPDKDSRPDEDGKHVKDGEQDKGSNQDEDKSNKEEEENKQSRSVFVCAEPSPDVLTAISANLSGKFKKSEGEATFQEILKQLGTRNATIQLLRDGLYRQCEAYMNGVIDGKTYERIANKYVNAMVVLLAIEKVSVNKDTATDDVPKPDKGAGNEGKPKTGNTSNNSSDKKKKFSEDGIESQDGDIKSPLAIAIMTKAFLQKDTVDYCFYNLSGGMRRENKMSPEFPEMCADLVREYAKRIEVEENPDSLKDECDRTPLHLAARNNNDPEVIRTLIERGADVNAKDCENRTPLHLAAKHNNNPEAAKLLIERGADVNAADGDGNASLYLAAKHNNNPEVAKLLIERGADVNAADSDGNAPLHLAAKYNSSLGVARILIDNGADVNAENHYAGTPLHLAARDNGSSEVTRLLIEKGADANATDSDGNAPLHLAAKYNGSLGVARVLIEKSENKNAKGAFGSTPLHNAARYNNPEVVRVLIDNGADVKAANNGETPLHYAGLNSNPEVVKLLIEKGADVNAKDSENATPLHYAVRSTNPGATKLLLAKGADKDAKGHYGRTPLHYAIVDAVQKTNPEIIKLLIEACADVNIRDNGRNTPLDVCCKKMSDADAAEVKKWLRDPGSLTQGRCP